MTVHKYLIGIGGSGAKCVESLVHIAAAGLFKSNEPVHLAMIDPDKTNWNLKVLKSTLADYESARASLAYKDATNAKGRNDEDAWFSCAFESLSLNGHPTAALDNLVWSPVASEDTSLNLLLDIENASAQEKRLFRTLYSEAEMKEKLQFGFKGHPAIGSLLLSKEFNPELTLEELTGINNPQQQAYWTQFCGAQSNIRNIIADGTDVVRIMVVGSIFGGTGAAGVPTVIGKLHRLYEDAINQGRVQLGLVLMLPYFKFNKNKSGMQNGELCAEADDFILNSRYALKYYMDSGIAGNVDQIYLIGNSYYENLDFAVGGVDQKNQPLIPETIAALGIANFFSGKADENVGTRNVQYSRRRDIADVNADTAAIAFEELPQADRFRPRIMDFTRFAMASHRFLRIADNIYNDPALRKQESWFTVYFPAMRQGLILNRKPKETDRLALRNELVAFRQYLARYLEWVAETLKDVGNVKMDSIKQFMEMDVDNDYSFASLSPLTKDITWNSLKRQVRDCSVSKQHPPVMELLSNIRMYTRR